MQHIKRVYKDLQKIARLKERVGDDGNNSRNTCGIPPRRPSTWHRQFFGFFRCFDENCK